jgi:hypothetical protein
LSERGAAGDLWSAQFPVSSGLISYGPATVDTVRRAATYIDRILRGESPRVLPVQQPRRQPKVARSLAWQAL